MSGEHREAAWTPDAGPGGTGPGARTPAAAAGTDVPAAAADTDRGTCTGGRGPRWIISLRALVVVLAMAVAAAGVLWLEQAASSPTDGQLAAGEAAKVDVPPLDVPPLDGASSAATGPSGHGAPTPEAEASGPPGAGTVVVHVAGAVRHPGVYTLPSGSRIQQAIEAAGGALPTAMLDALNLAAAAADGTQILVPMLAKAGTAGAGGSGAGQGGSGAGQGGSGAGQGVAGTAPPGSTGVPLNLNTATMEQLDALPGVGPVLAGRIVAWRSDHGLFSSVEELDAVPGIGAKMLANIRPLVTVQ